MSPNVTIIASNCTITMSTMTLLTGENMLIAELEKLLNGLLSNIYLIPIILPMKLPAALPALFMKPSSIIAALSAPPIIDC